MMTNGIPTLAEILDMAKQKQTSVIQKVAGNTPAKKTRKIVNNIEIVFDESGSMGSIREQAVKAVNSQLQSIIDNSVNSGQEVNVGITFFNTTADRRFSYRGASNINLLTTRQYNPEGNTALWDAIGLAIDNAPDAKANTDTSYMLIVVTDGGENSSTDYTVAKLGKKIKQCIASDVWTFAFSVPASGVRMIQTLGIDKGSIQTWDGSEVELYKTTTANNMVFTNYCTARAAGETKVSNVYLNISKVTKKDISSLDNVTDSFHEFTVNEEKDISSFVDGKLSNSNTLSRRLGSSYVPGNGYYQISKPETVQDYKEIVIKDVKNGNLYHGDRDDINSILGLADSTCKVTPLIGGQYQVFVQSTSMNRKLVRGTSLLYKIQ